MYEILAQLYYIVLCTFNVAALSKGLGVTSLSISRKIHANKQNALQRFHLTFRSHCYIMKAKY